MDNVQNFDSYINIPLLKNVYSLIFLLFMSFRTTRYYPQLLFESLFVAASVVKRFGNTEIFPDWNTRNCNNDCAYATPRN
jgi:hypothetical protein